MAVQGKKHVYGCVRGKTCANRTHRLQIDTHRGYKLNTQQIDTHRVPTCISHFVVGHEMRGVVLHIIPVSAPMSYQQQTTCVYCVCVLYRVLYHVFMYYIMYYIMYCIVYSCNVLCIISCIVSCIVSCIHVMYYVLYHVLYHVLYRVFM